MFIVKRLHCITQRKTFKHIILKATATIVHTEIGNSTLMATYHSASCTRPRAKGLETGTLKISAFTPWQLLALTGAVLPCYRWYHARKWRVTSPWCPGVTRGHLRQGAGWGCGKAAADLCSPSVRGLASHCTLERKMGSRQQMGGKGAVRASLSWSHVCYLGKGCI